MRKCLATRTSVNVASSAAATTRFCHQHLDWVFISAQLLGESPIVVQFCCRLSVSPRAEVVVSVGRKGGEENGRIDQTHCKSIFKSKSNIGFCRLTILLVVEVK